MNRVHYIIVVVVFVFCLTPGFGEDFDWPSWRGPEKNSISRENNLDFTKLNKKPQILWKGNVGSGYSSFSIQGNFLYTMGNSKSEDTVWCLDALTGKKIWSYSYKARASSYRGPRATPIIDGQNLYTMSEWGDLFCFNAGTGKVIWNLSITKEYKVKPPTWNLAGSPVVEGNVLYLNANTYGLALDKRNGKKIWSSPPGRGGYSSPVLCTIEKIDYVIIFGQKALYGVNRKTGEKIWEYPWVTGYDVNAADPLVVGDQIFISSDYGAGCALFKIKKKKATQVWRNKVMNSHFSSFVFIDGYIYGNDGSGLSERNGKFKSMKLSSGEVTWEEKLGFGSLLATEDYLIMLSYNGNLTIAKVNPKKYEQVAQTTVLSGTNWTPPVLVNGKIYCRNNKGDIVCLDVSKKK